MTTYKTVLAPGAPWPKVEEWTKFDFKHARKPIRVIKPKPKPAVKKHKLTEAVMTDGVFQHPKDDPLAKARAQLAQYAKQRKAMKELTLEPKQVFYFSKAKASK